MTDNIIGDLTRQADRIQKQIDGPIIMVTYRYTDRDTRKDKMVKLTQSNIESVYADIGKAYWPGSWDDAVEMYKWKLVRQVKVLRDHCDMMTDLIEKRHGADLYPVERIERQSKGFADRTEAKAWLDALKAEGWTGRIVTNMYKGIGEVGRYTAQARRTV